MVDKCFLTVPTKSTEESGFGIAVKRAVGTQFTKQSSDNAIFAGKDLEGLRRNAVGRVLARDESSLQILYRYYDQLGSLESKVPAVNYLIPFKWSNAFDKPGIFSSQKFIVQNSLAFEKVCVLFNAAALLSQIAANQDVDSDEGLKMAMKDFQLSAGIFQYVKDHVQSTIQQEPTPDLLQDTFTALVALMTAQAQEMCFFKAVKDGMKDNVIAKVAAQTADYYSSAAKIMQKDNIRTCWDKDWLSIVAAKQAGYLAIAEYYMALGHKEQKDVGEELARLKAAMDLMQTSKRSFDTPQFPFRKMEAAIQRAFESARKDNDFIYHAVVPDIKALSPIARAPFAKPVPPTFPLSQNFAEMFAPLVPNPPSSSCVIS